MKKKNSSYVADIAFKIGDDVKALYDKYAVPAMEFASKEEYETAAKLIQNILDEKPDAEVALLLKANYLFNHAQKLQGSSFHDLSNLKALKRNEVISAINRAKPIKENLEETIKLTKKAQGINPKNHHTEEFLKFILPSLTSINQLLENCESFLKTLDETTKTELNITCPYCNAQNLFTYKKIEDEYQCPACNKTFKAIIGVVKSRRGTHKTYGFGASMFELRITFNQEQRHIVFYTDAFFTANQEDAVALLFKKGWLSDNYNSTPCAVINYNLQEYRPIKAHP